MVARSSNAPGAASTSGGAGPAAGYTRGMVRTTPARSGTTARIVAVAGIALGAAALAALDPGAPSRAAAALRDAGPLGAALLALAYVVGALLFVPAPLLNLAAGFALGPILGTAVAIPAATAGACTAFAAGRWLIRGPVTRLAARAPALAGMEDALAAAGFRVVLLLRLAPLAPFAILNYLLGSTPVRLRDFALASALGSLPGLLLQVYLGSVAASAEELLAAARTGRGAGALLLGLGATGAVMAGVGWALRRAAARATSSGA